MAFINLSLCLRVVFNDSATIQIYSYRHTLSLHDALPISRPRMAEKIGRKVDRMDANQRRRTCSQLSLDERDMLRAIDQVAIDDHAEGITFAFERPLDYPRSEERRVGKGCVST